MIRNMENTDFQIVTCVFVSKVCFEITTAVATKQDCHIVISTQFLAATYFGGIVYMITETLDDY